MSRVFLKKLPKMFIGDIMIRIREIRIERKKTSKEVAEYLGLKPQHYCRYEKEVVKIQCEMIIKLAYYYNVTADYLLGIIDEPRPLK